MPPNPDEAWPLQDYRSIQQRTRKIIAAAHELTPFQADFLKEILRMATRFKETFRMTPKQLEIFEELYDEFALPGELDAKTNKDVITPQASDEPT